MSCFCVAVYKRFDKVRLRCLAALCVSWTHFVPMYTQITDLVGSSNFVILSLVSLYAGAETDADGFSTRRQVVTTLVAISRIELALYLFIRVLVRGRDARFDAIRNNTGVRHSTSTPALAHPLFGMILSLAYLLRLLLCSIYHLFSIACSETVCTLVCAEVFPVLDPAKHLGVLRQPASHLHQRDARGQQLVLYH